MMNVGIVTDSYLPEVSGTAIRVHKLVDPLLRDHAVHVEILTLQGEEFIPAQGESSPKALKGPLRVHRYRSEIQLLLGLKKILREGRLDLLHLRGVRYAVFTHFLFPALVIPVILEINSVNQQSNPIKKRLWKAGLHSPDRWILLSESARDWAARAMNLPEKKLDVVVNGVDSRWLANCQKESENRTREITVGYIGSFHEWQGVLDFVRTASQVVRSTQQAAFLMVGDGPSFSDVQDLIHTYQLEDYFTLPGLVAQEAVPDYLAVMDIVLIPRPERFLKNQLAIPLKVLEAMASGKAVVVTPVAGLAEAVEHLHTGLVAGPKLEGLSRAVVRLIEDKTLRMTLGRNAHDEVKEHYSWEEASQKLRQSYDKALARSR
jgi:glycosyltransferase involved in cell wall biosynthesis